MEKRIAKLEKELRDLKSKVWCSKCEVPFGAMLSDRDILRLIKEGKIKIKPMPNVEFGNDSDLDTCKVDLHLGEEALLFDAVQVSHIDAREELSEKYFRKINIKKLGKLMIHPGEVIVAVTLEWLTLPDDISGRMEGKSSLARKGLSVQAAPLFDAGWDGRPILELNNVGKLPIIVHFGSPICAMSFTHLSSPTLKSYDSRANSRYKKQRGARI
ncbi:MAG: dCTP deaminase [bacterium]|nr:dCTP deaminase [bacterium]